MCNRNKFFCVLASMSVAIWTTFLPTAIAQDFSSRALSGESVDPSKGNGNDIRVKASEKLQKLKSEIQEYDKAICLDPEQSSAYADRGHAKMQLKDFSGAIKDYDEALRLHPSDLVYRARGDAKCALKEFASAIQDYSEAIRLYPTYATLYYQRGSAKAELKDFKGAITDFDEAIHLYPKFGTAYNGRGIAKSYVGDYAGATKDFDETINLKPKFSNGYFSRGTLRSLSKDYKGAVKDFDEAIRLDPKVATAYLSRGTVRLLQSDYVSAMTDFDQAILLDPLQAADAYPIKSIILSCSPEESQRNAGEAMNLADAALATKSSDGNAEHAKACATALTGDFEAAIEWERKAMQNEQWKHDATITGGKLAEERISSWQSKELWLLPKTLGLRVGFSLSSSNGLKIEIDQPQSRVDVECVTNLQIVGFVLALIVHQTTRQ